MTRVVPLKAETERAMTGGTLFSGGEGVGVGMRAAGITHLWGIESDPAVADAARANGFHVITADVRAVDPASLPRVDVLHASPVCKNASTAKADAKEAPEDVETAQAACRFIETLRPRVFTLENVWGYRKFRAFAAILDTLARGGYQVKYWHLNSADYGVPQTRKRLILVASLDCLPHKPPATHTARPRPMFETLKPWIGWYEAIEDLVPTLPPSRFAPWQLERLPKELQTLAMWSNGNAESFGRHHVYGKEPALTVTAQTEGRARAFLVHRTDMRSMPTREGEEPSFTIMAGSFAGSHMPGMMPRAFVMAGGDNWTPPADRDEPIFTIGSSRSEHPIRAFVMGNNQSDDKRGGTYGCVARSDEEPYLTVTALEQNAPKAFLVDSANSSNERHVYADRETSFAVGAGSGVKLQTRAIIVDGTANDRGASRKRRAADAPIMTVTSTHKNSDVKALLERGRVVAMTPRALARFQSFPDDYILPANKRLACAIIGNAVPPLLYEKVIGSICFTGGETK